jgi:predicted DsbA family dithiol-disulfide isomerase
MLGVLWSDYICPWCYLGQDRTALLRSLGVAVTPRPFELHPDIPIGGIPIRRRYSRIAAGCADAGLPFRPPTVVPNSRRALLTAESVRLNAPHAFEALDRALFTAYFVNGLDIGDPDVIDDLVEQSGAGKVDLDDALLASSMEEAYEAGIGGTPAWLIDGRLLIPGVQDRSYYERMIERLRTSSSSPS